MPYPAASEPLERVTLNLFASDVEWLKRKFGRGWTDTIRRELRAYVEIEQELER